MTVQHLLLTAVWAWPEILRNLRGLGQAPKLSQRWSRNGYIHPRKTGESLKSFTWFRCFMNWNVRCYSKSVFLSPPLRGLWRGRTYRTGTVRNTHFPDFSKPSHKIQVCIFNKLLNVAHPTISKWSVYTHMQRNWMPKWLVFICLLVFTGIQITFWMQNQFGLSP